MARVPSRVTRTTSKSSGHGRDLQFPTRSNRGETDEMAHTPGKWEYGKRPDGSIWLSIGDPGVGPHYQADLHATEDDAKLIITAPDLYKIALIAHRWSTWIEDVSRDMESSAGAKTQFDRDVAFIQRTLAKAEGK